MSAEYTSYEKLILSLASMDAYNRGLAPSVAMQTESAGPLTILTDSNKKNIGNIYSDGFAAVAYTVSGTGTSLDGKTVIAYRGTDNPTLATDPVKGASDILTGWIAALGEPNAQTQLAFDFYQAVTGGTAADPNVVVTGHSLGGGLAGHVGALARSTAHATWRGGRALLQAAAIAALLLFPFDLAHAQDGTLETGKEGTSMTTNTAADRPSIDWFFRERPSPSQFVLPEGEASCAVTKVTATEPVIFAARRHGGNVALSVELQAQEDVEAIAISKSQTLTAQFYRTAPQRLPDSFKDRGEPGAVDTHSLQMPTNEFIFVLLCRIGGRYYLSYSLNIG